MFATEGLLEREPVEADAGEDASSDCEVVFTVSSDTTPPRGSVMAALMSKAGAAASAPGSPVPLMSLEFRSLLTTAVASEGREGVCVSVVSLPPSGNDAPALLWAAI